MVPILLLITLACRGYAQTAQHPQSPSADRVTADFENRLTNYLDLRKKQVVPAAKPTTQVDQIASERRQEAAKTTAARANAKQGDIFTPTIASYFRHQIAAAFAGRQGHRVRASLAHAEPLPPMPLQVNQAYPHDLPLQSTPPSLLAKLPHLPQELEYRIVGNAMTLRDVTTNLVVDFIPHAIPAQ
jgi:hypothetical protein